ncbi:glutathione-disulfide reductase [Sneathiella sp. P13V-1]|uniref:glutathione-disulfide reductase n=1 Tax=Sneathiella sp. P13V-1 TaxID=2697366 RepID=UPI00187B5642|nr:glutathione-disulfide reductase [Sneathiella sp. P13V-1]MBE7637127.1 glutathione-disulfide reductase [Sneathiella sp. P13V-1]
MSFDYDLFVIGAGSGGVRASRISSSLGAKVAIAEEYRVGGTCVIRGCVPKKMFVYASHFAEDFEDAKNYGWDVTHGPHDWKRLIKNKDAEIDRLNGIYHTILSNNNVELFEARAEIIDKNTLKVGDKTVTAKYILIATGGTPMMPDVPGIEHAISSNEAFHLDEMPKRVIVVGGGYIAVEFAGIFNGLGADVVQLYRGEQILRGFDHHVQEMVAQEIVKKGVDLRTRANPASIEKTESGLKVTLEDGSVLETDAIMYATGRKANTEGLGLENAGVEMKPNGAVKVDEYSRTNVDNIYAVGDVTDRIALTPVAIHEGMAFAETVFANTPRAFDHSIVPSAVFSQPPVGSVGLTEAEAREQYGDVDIYKAEFRPLKQTITLGSERAMCKIIVDQKSDRVLGVHVVGADAGEIIQGVGIAVKMGATKAQFDATVGVHPTLAEELVTMREKYTGD